MNNRELLIAILRAVKRGEVWDRHFPRIVLLNLKMRPRPWRSWRHHRLVLGVGYFTLSFSRLEQTFITEASMLATSRADTYSKFDKEAELAAWKDVFSISGNERKKAALWAKEARKMSNDEKSNKEIDQIVSEAADLSSSRQAIVHYFAFLGEEFDLFSPARYVQAVRFIKIDPKRHANLKTDTIPLQEKYTYDDLKELDQATMQLVHKIHELRFQLAQEFYRFASQKI